MPSRQPSRCPFPKEKKVTAPSPPHHHPITTQTPPTSSLPSPACPSPRVYPTLHARSPSQHPPPLHLALYKVVGVLYILLPAYVLLCYTTLNPSPPSPLRRQIALAAVAELGLDSLSYPASSPVLSHHITPHSLPRLGPFFSPNDRRSGDYLP
jgi:hypothetical protein